MTISTFKPGTANAYQTDANNALNFRDSLVTVQVQFNDFNNVPTAVANPKMAISQSGHRVTPEAITANPNPDKTYALSATVSTGIYAFSFLTRGLQPGIYDLEFTGDFTDPNTQQKHTILVNGQIGLGEITRMQDWINRVTTNLMDDHPQDYRLDEPVHQWTKQQIFSYLRESIGRFNTIGPRRTMFDSDTMPPDTDELVVTGGVIWALWARARFEKASEMSYSDVHTLDIKRADFYKSLADSMYQDWERNVKGFKIMSPPLPVGLQSQRLPFRVYRTLGLLPNYQSFFSA